MSKYQISGGSLVERRFLEAFLERHAVEQANEPLQRFKEALKQFPIAESLIENNNYEELCNYIQKEIGELKKEDEYLEIALEHFSKMKRKLDEYRSEHSRPYNRQSAVYGEWSRDVGKLEGLLIAAYTDCEIAEKFHSEPAHRKRNLLEALLAHIRDKRNWLEAENERLENIYNQKLEAIKKFSEAKEALRKMA
jgi:hypothetical protein